MANIGVSKPYYAAYTNTGTTVTYASGAVMGKATTVSIEANSSDPVILYGDNGPAESDTTFGGGTLKLGLTELSLPVAADVLGLETGSFTSPTGATLDFKAGASAPYLGTGFVVKKQVNGARKWLAILLTKVQFKMPALSVETQGQEISFQTPEMEATILRDDTADEVWQKWGLFDSETDAENFVKGFLSISDN